IETIIEKEHDARQILLQKKPSTLWDQIGRAYGVLTYAHAMASKEALNLLSIIKLGIDLGAFAPDHRLSIDELFIDTQPAHLQKCSEQKLNAEERDYLRAQIIRDRLKLLPKPDISKMVGNVPYTPRVKKVLALAGKEAKALNHSYVGTEHILLGLLREGEGVAARVLKSLELDIERTRNEILKELDPNFMPSDADQESGEPTKRDVKTPALRAFGRDLTDLARKGELDPVIGRRNEIERVIQVLCRRTKNNPVLIGEAGVGKTAIAEGLAQEI